MTRLRGTTPVRPSWDDERPQWLLYVAGGRVDDVLRNRLIEPHVPLAISVATRFASRLKAYAYLGPDLESAALEGLLHAARLFDPDRGVKFCTYAHRACWQWCQRQAENLDDQARQWRQRKMAAWNAAQRGYRSTPREPVVFEPLPGNPFDVHDLREGPAARAELRDEARAALEAVRRYGGEHGGLLVRKSQTGETLQTIADDLGITKEAVRLRIKDAQQKTLAGLEKRRRRRRPSAVCSTPNSRTTPPIICTPARG